jgi:hypothetical protein
MCVRMELLYVKHKEETIFVNHEEIRMGTIVLLPLFLTLIVCLSLFF